MRRRELITVSGRGALVHHSPLQYVVGGAPSGLRCKGILSFVGAWSIMKLIAVVRPTPFVALRLSNQSKAPRKASA